MLKQFVIIPKRPKMSVGKIASQTAHATFMALENQKQLIKNKKSNWDNIEQWKETGMCVIVCQCKDEIKLHGIAKYCEQWGIPHHLYIDEGLTEIPMGTATAFATGIIPEDMQWMFEKLGLY